MEAPLVSILIPCYNAEPWLEAALDSALGQTWKRCEIIVIDDGSTDGSLALARTYESRGVQVVTQSNQGQCAAGNHALRLARGNFIKFFDADDLLSSEMIELQVNALVGQPDCLAYSEWGRFYNDPLEANFTPCPSWRCASPVDWLVKMLEQGEAMFQCAQFLIPRNLLAQNGGWDERLSLINDFEFFTRLAAKSRGIIFTPGARLYYRSNLPKSLSARRSGSAWESACLSVTLGTEHLLAAENSSRTRRAAANALQSLVYEMYPSAPSLVAEIESRIQKLGGASLCPAGGSGFKFARRLLGWKIARRLQIAAGKFPAP